MVGRCFRIADSRFLDRPVKWSGIVVWAERYRVAACGLLIGFGVLAMLDFVGRNQADPPGASVAYLAVALFLGAGAAAFMDWKPMPPLYRLAPAALGIVALLMSVVWTQTPSTSHATTGFAAASILVLSYVGFVMPPGSALMFSPLLVLTLLLAHQREAATVSLALPVVVVPVAALLGELVSSLTDHSARSISRSASQKQTLSRLEEVLRGFRSPETLNEAAQQVARAATELFEVDRATVVLRDVPDGLVSVTVGPSSSEVPDSQTAQLVVDTIGGTAPRIVPTAANQHMLVLPLYTSNESTGAVVVHPLCVSDPEFSLDLARLFGAQVGLAIEHLFVINELRRATTRDELTGIGNRKHADSLLASLEEGDAVIILDLDGFKEVNDTLGHSAGDAVLQELSAHLRHCLRDSDTSARLGGDEFLIVAHRAFAAPLAVADRVLVGWAKSGRSTTLSAGVALHEPGADVSVTFDRADQALYQAKAAGKNRAHMWYPESDDSAINPNQDGVVDQPEVGATPPVHDPSNHPVDDIDSHDRRTQQPYFGYQDWPTTPSDQQDAGPSDSAS